MLSKKKKNALEGICKVLGLLLDYGANPSGTLVDLEDEGMISPLYFACCLNEPKIVAYLIDSGAKVNDFNDSLVELCRGEEGIFDYREKCSPSLFFTNMSLKNMITYAHDAQKEYLEEYDGIVDSYFTKRVSKSFEVAEQSCRAIIKLLVDNGAQDFPPDLKKEFEWDPWDYYK